MKVDQLFKKYYRILNEQDPAPNAAVPETPPEAAPAEMSPPQETAPTEPEIVPIDANERMVIKILTNAFIFNKTLFDENKRKYIDNTVTEIQNSVNVPVAKTVDEIKKIINLDQSLHIESKTLKLLAKYRLMLEQPADATEPQPGTETSDQPEDKQPEAPEENINSLNLAEIFPEYKELILLALNHIPTAEEIMILKPVVREFSKTDPEKITVTIKDLLNFREGGTASNREGRKKSLEGDDSIEQYLANA
jgi:hypothetical protein